MLHYDLRGRDNVRPSGGTRILRVAQGRDARATSQSASPQPAVIT
ncbi:MAG: hypothetical protein NZ749_12255 [bacterium]|nr:hypothetical protein [bacterium]